MAVIIPFGDADPHYSFEVELGESSYVLEARWNEVTEGWFLTISDSIGNVLLSGLRVVVDFPIGRRFADSRLPDGIILATDTTNRHADPGRYDLGTRVQVYFIPTSEL